MYLLVVLGTLPVIGHSGECHESCLYGQKDREVYDSGPEQQQDIADVFLMASGSKCRGIVVDSCRVSGAVSSKEASKINQFSTTKQSNT